MNLPGELPLRYVVVESDRFAEDRDRAVLRLNGTLGPQYADRWYRLLSQTLADLIGFPGPLSHARDEEASATQGREVRRLLYYGATRRRTGIPVRILFSLLPPADDDPEAETVILLLRLLHGPQSLTSPEDAS